MAEQTVSEKYETLNTRTFELEGKVALVEHIQNTTVLRLEAMDKNLSGKLESLNTYMQEEKGKSKAYGTLPIIIGLVVGLITIANFILNLRVH